MTTKDELEKQKDELEKQNQELEDRFAQLQKRIAETKPPLIFTVAIEHLTGKFDICTNMNGETDTRLMIDAINVIKRQLDNTLITLVEERVRREIEDKNNE